ncbi:MAG: transposase [Deltaproteobacteria bacterium]|nr:transposase [Deltaproteobacteria bacterium]
MPRRSRIDAAGAISHVMGRGIERGFIFKSDTDRDHFLERLGKILQDTETICYAWALIPNHFHLLLRTGTVPISTVMRRLLTGYALWFNRKHGRNGHVFQNRFKSILCQEDAYLLELVRYIHLNPIRAKLVEDLDELDRYAYCGHSVLMGKIKIPWQNREGVLGMFAKTLGAARRAYRTFVEEGIAQGRRKDLSGGGLLRSAGGWEGVKAKREENVYQRHDERILGDGAFVEHVLESAQENMEKRYALRSRGLNLEGVASRVSDVLGLEPDEVWTAGKYRRIVEARSLLCYWAVRELGTPMSSLARRLGLSVPSVSDSVTRGRKLAEAKGYSLLEN